MTPGLWRLTWGVSDSLRSDQLRLSWSLRLPGEWYLPDRSAGWCLVLRSKRPG